MSEFFSQGQIGAWGALPIMESPRVPPCHIYLMPAGEYTYPALYVRDPLRFMVRIEMYAFIEERFVQAYRRLGLEPPIRVKVIDRNAGSRLTVRRPA